MLREMRAPRTSPYDELTEREREVLELVAEGRSNQEVGERLGLAEKTIKHHMASILGKLPGRGSAARRPRRLTTAGHRRLMAAA